MCVCVSTIVALYANESSSSSQEETVLEILGLAHQYGFEDLESAICDYLKDALCIPNVCVIYDMATLYSLCNLKAVCEDFMDKNALPILNHESFYSLSPVSNHGFVFSLFLSLIHYFMFILEFLTHCLFVSVCPQGHHQP